jgi:ComEC/Rec2-related protein
MTVAMVWVFFLSRLLISFSTNISLKYDNKKKLSVFIAAILGFIYLLITGMPVSAVRAFLMVLLFLVAVLFDKFSISLHPVAVAAFIIMLIMPEQILFPSFQLSFAAVIGLIGLYEFYEQKFKKNRTKDFGFIKRQFILFTTILGTTFFTSITTAPFGILHFGAFQNFGIISNMIGVPAVSILVLPFAFLSILFMPLGLEKPFLWVAEQGAFIIKKTSDYVSNLPSSVSYFADIPNYFIIFIVIGFFIFFIFKTKIRGLA